MPIDRSLYPENWEEIALQVKTEAKWICQQCGRQCKRSDECWAEFARRGCLSGEIDGKYNRYILTVAHLDQNPANNDRSNLKALCSVCHLNHDRPFRQHNALAKRERRGQLNLFELVHPTLAGHGKDPARIQLPIKREVK